MTFLISFKNYDINPRSQTFFPPAYFDTAGVSGLSNPYAGKPTPYVKFEYGPVSPTEDFISYHYYFSFEFVDENSNPLNPNLLQWQTDKPEYNAWALLINNPSLNITTLGGGNAMPTASYNPAAPLVSTSNYFILDLNTLAKRRTYKLKLKVVENGISTIIDEKYIFEIV